MIPRDTLLYPVIPCHTLWYPVITSDTAHKRRPGGVLAIIIIQMRRSSLMFWYWLVLHDIVCLILTSDTLWYHRTMEVISVTFWMDRVKICEVHRFYILFMTNGHWPSSSSSSSLPVSNEKWAAGISIANPNVESFQSKSYLPAKASGFIWLYYTPPHT